MKSCSICLKHKPYSAFYARIEECRLRSDCIDCFNIRAKARYMATRDRQLESRKQNYKANKPRYNQQSAEWRANHPEKMTEYKRNWKKRNKGKLNADWMSRDLAKRNATPAWLTKEHKKQMEEIYVIASDLSWLSEGGLHVDHIVPIRGKQVNGLHVPWNLQILPASVNIKKSNKVDYES